MFPDQYNMYNGTKNYQNKTMKGTKKKTQKNEMKCFPTQTNSVKSISDNNTFFPFDLKKH